MLDQIKSFFVFGIVKNKRPKCKHLCWNDKKISFCDRRLHKSYNIIGYFMSEYYIYHSKLLTIFLFSFIM